MIRRICPGVLLACALVGCVSLPRSQGSLFQVSPLAGLMQGDYDGYVAIAAVKKQGDFGIGTMHGLDGELVVLDNRFYQVSYAGGVREVRDSETTPFAMVTFFTPDEKFPVRDITSAEELRRLVDAKVPSRNRPCAFLIEGTFSSLKARSVEQQHKPYAPLSDVVKRQSVFAWEDIPGTIVGFRLPGYLSGMNMPGYHMHFISRDKKHGGHVLECAVSRADVSLQMIDRVSMVLPRSREFEGMDFDPGAAQSAYGVEKQK